MNGLRALGAVCCSIILLAGTARAASGRFDAEIAAFESADRLRPPPAGAVLFVGSSSIRLWPSLPDAFPGRTILNRGFGGSEMEDLLFYLDRIVLPYAPSRIVVYEGDNDLAAGKSPESITGEYRQFIDRIALALPETVIHLLAVKPSPSRIALIEAQRQLNARLRELAAGDRVRFVDVFTPMLDNAGQPRAALYQADQLHLSRSGYDVWESVVAEALEDGTAPVPVSVLLDFGPEATATRLEAAPGDPVRHWNNLTTAQGTVPGTILPDLLSSRGRPTGIELRVRRRFNAANSSGTLQSSVFPGRATQDSLFGNVGPFAGLADVLPAFDLAGLAPGRAHDLVFHASRLFTSEHRETRFRVFGATVSEGLLEPANNVDSALVLTGVVPDSRGTLRIEMEPGPGNDSPSRFIHLGALELRTTLDPAASPVLADARQIDGSLRFRIHGPPGSTYTIESSGDLRSWIPIGTGILDPAHADVTVAIGAGPRWLRARTGTSVP